MGRIWRVRTWQITFGALNIRPIKQLYRIDMNLKWRNARESLPSDYQKQLCLVMFNDMGGEGRLYQRILHYDIKNKFWCEVDPSCCTENMRKPLEWETVEYWIPMADIMNVLV